VVEDVNVRAIIEDPEIQELIKNNNYAKLLSNPKMKAIMKDKDLIQKIFALNKQIMQENMKRIEIPK